MAPFIFLLIHKVLTPKIIDSLRCGNSEEHMHFAMSTKLFGLFGNALMGEYNEQLAILDMLLHLNDL